MLHKLLIAGLILALCNNSSFAQAVRFSSATDTMRVPGQTVVLNQMTIEARIYLAPGATRTGTVFWEQCQGLEDKALVIGAEGAIGGAWTSVAYQLRTERARAGPLIHGVWHHVAFVRDSAEERLYIDGVLRASTPWTGNIGNANCGVPVIGAGRSGYSNDAPDAAVDWLRVSRSARYFGSTAAPPYCEPVSDADTLLLFLFNDPPGSPVAIDSGPSSLHAALGTGFPGATHPQFVSISGANGGPSLLPPKPAMTCTGDVAVLSASPSGANAPGVMTFRWHRRLPSEAGFSELQNGLSPHGSILSGVSTPQLVIAGISLQDEAEYLCVAQGSCGVGQSTAAYVAVSTRCPCSPADVATDAPGNLSEPDGFLTGVDFDFFVESFFLATRNRAGLLIADLANDLGVGIPDGAVSGADFDTFIQYFFQGC